MTTKITIMLHRKYTFFSLLMFFFLTSELLAVTYKQNVDLKWNDIQKISLDSNFISRLNFKDAVYDNYNSLPSYINVTNIHSFDVAVNTTIENGIYVDATEEEQALLINCDFVNTDVVVSSSISGSRKQPVVITEVIPIRYNKSDNTYQKLVSFEIITEVTQVSSSARAMEYSSTSVLADGDWYKIKIKETGIYKISYSDLQSMGFDLNSSPSNFALFGNGGALLPEKNNDFHYDDLFENPIVVIGGDDGKWNEGDYALFYGQGPITWKYNPVTGSYYHQTNYYRDYTYYFITSLAVSGKRIVNNEIPTQSAEMEISTFTDYAVHEISETNIAGVGRTWYGESFDYDLDYYFDFDFPNIITEEGSAYFKSRVAARAYSSSAFKFYINNNLEKTLSMSVMSTSNRYEYAKASTTNFEFTPDNDQLVVHLEYLRSASSSVGYLDYFEINVQRQLQFAGNQMSFRKHVATGESVVKYIVGNGDNVTVWDVTTPVSPEKVVTQQQGSSIEFLSNADVDREYIAFNNQEYMSAEFVEKVPNQNLHGYRNIDYLIVTHPDFLEQADSLAAFHRQYNNMTVLVATINQVYNEFSSGGQDISAIRNFAKMLYDDSDSGSELKYMLLFGDASYDYKDILPDNSNFVPCWESVSSLDIVSSIATDDYFGFLDDGEGVEGSKDFVDIGIGRFVVRTVDEAESAIDKTIHYTLNTSENMGPWRNIVTFIADDGDGNRHLKDAETLSDIFDTAFQVYNVSKIYTDAYEQETTPSGQRAPEVNQAITDRIEKGTLIFNYSGHGGEIGLGHEQIVQVSDINSWTNYDMLSVFITATCEFTRYDDPTRVSAGEYVFLNQKGGGITLFTTSRATYAGSNLALNLAIYENNMFTKIDGEYPTFGDIIRKSKKLGTSNDKKFVLIGDPACRMVYPDYNAETIEINSTVVLPEQSDTIKALQLVQIKGITTDRSGNKLDNYNGELFISVYDKKSEIQTYGDEGSSYTYYVRNNIIFNGKATITNGDFELEFMVPKDIAYKYGIGKISYYFKDEDGNDVRYDGNGYYNNIVVGGFDTTAVADDQGPEIELFMNDTSFYNGGIVNQNPNLLAFVKDSSGINTTGVGIGHDIVSVINEDKEMTYVLNDYYQANENKFNEGEIVYPFIDLPEGEHTLSLKVWDVYNNSTTAYLDFVVVASDNVVISNLKNYPNPFMDVTNFVFDHNQKGNEIEVTFEIYSLDGRKMKSMKTVFTPEATQSEPVVWNGDTDEGGKIDQGFYVYRVIVKNENGVTGEDTSKLIYLK